MPDAAHLSQVAELIDGLLAEQCAATTFLALRARACCMTKSSPAGSSMGVDWPRISCA